jgi:hypothetical protein
MSTEISDADQELLLAYARRKYAQEQWPLAEELRPVREALEPVFPKREPPPLPSPRPHLPSLHAQRQKRRR